MQVLGGKLPIPGGEGTSSLIGVGLALGANSLIAVALNVQRLAHLRQQNKRDRVPSSSSSRKSSAENRSPERSLRSSEPPTRDERTPLLVAPPPTLHRSATDPEPSQENPQTLVPAISTTAPSPTSSPPTRSLHRTRSRSLPRRPRTDKGFLRSKTWLLGFVLLNCGEFLNFLAYGFAPPSVVAPLGMVTLIANVFLAPLIVKEPFRKRDLVGVAIAILGGVTVVYASRSSDKKPTPPEFLQAISQPLFMTYAAVSATCIALLAYLSRTAYGDRFVLIDLVLCALAGAFTVLCTKALSSFLNLNPIDTFRSWITYPVLVVLILSALIQINYVNKSLQRFEARVVIPVQYCTFALSTIIGSAVLYRDFEGVGLPSMVNFAFGCAVCGAGVYLLTRPHPSPSSSSSIPTPHPPSYTRTSSAPSPISRKPLPFPSSSSPPHPGVDRDRLLPVPVAAARRGLSPSSAAGVERGRKLSLTLGGGYLLAGSPGVGSVRGGSEGPDEDGDSEGSDDEEEGDEESLVGSAREGRGRGTGLRE
ncbi:hypothetical protein JCM10207_008615 [Rhodosporidiobolus poonsookiae]